MLSLKPRILDKENLKTRYAIFTTSILSKNELAESLQISLDTPYFLVTFHPVTLENQAVEEKVDCLFKALIETDDTQAIVTLANADVGGDRVNKRVKEWAEKFPNRLHVFPSLGQIRYLSAMKHCIAVVGNSSSGIIEAPAMKVPTINIGNRQQGRVLASSVIQVSEDKNAIQHALQKSMANDFRKELLNTINPYGTEGVAKRIINVLKNVSNWGAITKKEFFDFDAHDVVL